MPTRAPRLCPCGQVVPQGERCACQIKADRERGARHDAKRPNSSQRGYTSAWDKARGAYLQKHRFCRICGKPAAVVDHIKPHRGDKALFWDRDNWQALCAPCHNSTKQRQERRGKG